MRGIKDLNFNNRSLNRVRNPEAGKKKIITNNPSIRSILEEIMEVHN